MILGQKLSCGTVVKPKFSNLITCLLFLQRFWKSCKFYKLSLNVMLLEDWITSTNLHIISWNLDGSSVLVKVLYKDKMFLSFVCKNKLEWLCPPQLMSNLNHLDSSLNMCMLCQPTCISFKTVFFLFIIFYKGICHNRQFSIVL